MGKYFCTRYACTLRLFLLNGTNMNMKLFLLLTILTFNPCLKGDFCDTFGSLSHYQENIVLSGSTSM